MGTLCSSQATVFIVVCELCTESLSRIEYVAGESQGSRKGGIFGIDGPGEAPLSKNPKGLKESMRI